MNPPKRKILILDDDLVALTFLTEILRRKEYEVIALSEAQKGFDTAKTAQPDLIILDVFMPGRNGWSLLSQLQAEEATRSIPIVMLTSDNKEDSQELAYGLGAGAYLTKPFNPERLEHTISDVLAKKP
jgi:CheY-like chemotaxis protein